MAKNISTAKELYEEVLKAPTDKSRWLDFLLALDESTIDLCPDPDTIVRMKGPSVYQWYYLSRQLEITPWPDLTNGEDWLLISRTHPEYLEHLKHQKLHWSTPLALRLFEHWPREIPWEQVLLTREDYQTASKEKIWLTLFFQQRNTNVLDVSLSERLQYLTPYQAQLTPVQKEIILNWEWDDKMRALLHLSFDLNTPLNLLIQPHIPVHDTFDFN